ncbi:hypothetical protein TRVA0_062S00540 [Trichomonascus vanleenenianus]|uniref:uncharacterized protein n=1 Tax=Trichomonascus vanleenenianus TaxID=2268995 RepID=UPI003ECA2AB3
MTNSKPRLEYSHGKSEGKRSTSGQFTQLSPAQIRELKEAYTLLDKDGDGTINRADLEEMVISLGQDPTDQYIEELFGAMPSPLTFSAFLTGMSAHLCNMSSRGELLKAFEAFSDDSGSKSNPSISADELEESLMEYGMSEADARMAMEAFVKKGFMGSRFHYRDFVDMMRAED